MPAPRAVAVALSFEGNHTSESRGPAVQINTSELEAKICPNMVNQKYLDPKNDKK